MTQIVTHSTATSLAVKRAKPEWTVTYPGFRITGQYNLSDTLFHISITPPAVSDVPQFKLSIPTPLPSKTWILLPGSTTLLGLSHFQEVSVVTMDSEASACGRQSTFDRLNPWFRKVIDEDGFVTVIKETAADEVEYCVQACGGVCEEIDEAFVVLSCYKFVFDENGSRKSVTSDNNYDRILDGL